MYAFHDENGFVLGLDVEDKDGYLEVSDDVMVGQQRLEDGSYITPDKVLSLDQLRKQRMETGVDFNGVMCSAYKEDQWGLASVKDFILSGQDVNYEFENGSVLELTSENLAAFEAVWIPFRQSCLKVNFTG